MVVEAVVAGITTEAMTTVNTVVIVTDRHAASLDRRLEARTERLYLVTIREIASNLRKENTMKSSIKDKVEGTFHEVKGKAKEVAGKLSDNPKLQAEGTAEKLAGRVQEKVGQVKKVLGK